jgi:hypothetical protein
MATPSVVGTLADVLMINSFVDNSLSFERSESFGDVQSDGGIERHSVLFLFKQEEMCWPRTLKGLIWPCRGQTFKENGSHQFDRL